MLSKSTIVLFGKLPSFLARKEVVTTIAAVYKFRQCPAIVVVHALALTNLWHSIIAVTFNQSISVDWYLIDWSACFYNPAS